MAEPILPLQPAVIAALKAHAPLAAIVGAKVYDRVPANTQPPYITITGWQIVEDGTDCADAVEIFFDAQCFSVNGGISQAAYMAGYVKDALHRLAPTTSGWGNTEILYRGTQYFTESDGTTTRAAVNFQALADSGT
jgi:hypothetical protein